MKLKLKTVYIPTKEKTNYKLFWDDRCIFDNMKQQEYITFTQEEYNKHIQEVIKQTLETAADNAETKIEEYYAGSLGNEFGELYNKVEVIDTQSITNTFEEIFNKYKINI